MSVLTSSDVYCCLDPPRQFRAVSGGLSVQGQLSACVCVCVCKRMFRAKLYFAVEPPSAQVRLRGPLYTRMHSLERDRGLSL